MLGFLYEAIGNLLGEEKIPDEPLEPPNSPQNPDNFCPGLLFDISATWVLFVKRLLVPESARSNSAGCSTASRCEYTCADSNAKPTCENPNGKKR